MSVQSDHLLKQIAASAISGDLKIMAGAGISLSSGLPTVYGECGLVPSILARTNIEQQDADLLMSYGLPFEAFFEKLNDSTEVKELLEIFELGEPSNIHYFLVELFGKGYAKKILTTNFDTLLETAAHASNIDLSVTKTDAEFDSYYDNAGGGLIKIHGCVSQKNEMAITLSQVAGAQLVKSREVVLRDFFRKTDTRCEIIMVIGYSASDVFDLSPIIEATASNDLLVVFVNHSKENSGLVLDISDISNVNTGSALGGDGIPEKNPLVNYSGFWVSADTDSFLESLAGLLNIGLKSRKDSIVNWQYNIDIWAQGIESLRMYYLCALLMNEICEYGRAKHYSDKLKGMSKTNMLHELSAKNIEAVVVHRQGDFQRAIELYKELYIFWLPNSKEAAGTAENIARALNETGSYSEAITWCMRSISAYKYLKDFRAVGRLKRTLSNSYSRSGRLQDALSLAHKALYYAAEYGDVKGEACARIALANALSEQTKWKEAMDELYKAKDIGYRVDDSYIIATGCNNIAVMSLRRKMSGEDVDISSAIDLVQKARDFAMKCGDMYSVDMSEENLKLLQLQQLG